MATKGDTPPKGPIAPPSVLARALSIPAFFLLTCYGWILFRAHSLAQIADLTGILVRDFGNLRLTVPLPPEASLVGLPVLFAIELAEFAGGGKSLRDLLPVPMWTAVYAVMIFALVLGAGAASPQFVYFTF
jgi:hypothetical protein